MSTSAVTPNVEKTMTFKIKKQVTLPLLKMREDVKYYVKFDGAIFKSKPNAAMSKAKEEKAKAGQVVMEEPELAHITNLETSEKMQVIINKVLGDTIIDSYPEKSYVGKSFELIKHKVAGGKRYATFSITEIEIEEEQTPAPKGKK